MDPHLVDLKRRVDLIDDAVRGDGSHPGLVENVRQVSAEQRRQGEELALLRAVPSQLEALTKASGARDERLDELGDRVGKLVAASERATAVREGEKKAMDRVSKWLKIAAGIGTALLAGGATGIIALLRELGELAGALP